MTVGTCFTRRWKVGIYTVTLTVGPIKADEATHATCEWSPHIPRRFRPGELAQYQAGRDKALRELCQERGLPLAVVGLVE